MRQRKVRLAALAVTGMVVSGMVIAQSQQPSAPGNGTRRFDVVSVKPCKAEDGGGVRNSEAGSGSPSPGRLDLKCRTVESLVQMAYVQFADGKRALPGRHVPISGGPAWIGSDRFDIEAVAEGAPGQATMNGPMMQVLLEDRFHLKAHRESREVPVYALTVAKSGTKLQAAQPGKCIPRDPDHPAPLSQRPPGVWPCGFFVPSPANDGFYTYGTTLANFCAQLSVLMDRDVIDKTGIAGMFDIRIEKPEGDVAEPGSPGLAAPASLTDAMGSAIFAAVQKVGLKLEGSKGTGEFLVIDRVEKPSEN